MLKRVSLLTLLFFLSVEAFAQFPSEIWHEGKIVLTTGDTLTGFIKYDLETDIVQFSDDDETINTYTARKFIHFEIFDKISGRYRRFYVLPYNIQGDYNAPIIFELVLEGRKLTLLSRESIEHQVTNYPYSVGGSYTRLELVYTHYFLTDEGEIVKFEGKKKDLYNGVMSKRSSEIKKFLKNNRVRVDSRRGIVKAVSYYNSLFEEK